MGRPKSARVWRWTGPSARAAGGERIFDAGRTEAGRSLARRAADAEREWIFQVRAPVATTEAVDPVAEGARQHAAYMAAAKTRVSDLDRAMARCLSLGEQEPVLARRWDEDTALDLRAAYCEALDAGGNGAAARRQIAAFLARSEVGASARAILADLDSLN